MAQSIQNLNDHVLFKIFSLLDENSLINLQDVCERFENLIYENSFSYRHIPLIINPCCLKADEYYTKLNYGNILIHEVPKGKTEAQKFVEKIINYHKENIKIAEFRLIEWNGWTSRNIAKFTNIQKLILKQSSSWKGLGNQFGTIVLENLKELEICDKFSIIAPNLERLTLYTPQSIPLIKTFPTLKHLKLLFYLINSNVKSVEFEEILQESISLKICIFDCPRYESILDLLKGLKDSVKSLHVESDNVNREMEFIIYERNVEKLTLAIPDKFEIRQKLNTSIKNLKLHVHASYDEKIAYKILKSCPSIEILTIDNLCMDIPHEFLEIVATFLPNLKELNLTDYTHGFAEEIDLKSIEKISIQNWKKSARDEWVPNFMRLIISCKNLKKIVLEGRRHFSRAIIFNEILPENSFIKLLKELKNLEEIHANQILRLSTNVVDFLIINQLKLRILKFGVQENELEQQKELSARLSLGSNIQCTVFRV